jgi:hypothetical protein
MGNLNRIDYGPARAILYMEELAEMSGDKAFSHFADILRSDMPFLKPGAYDQETELPRK